MRTINCNGIAFPLQYAINHNMIDNEEIEQMAIELEQSQSDYDSLQESSEEFESELDHVRDRLEALLHDLEADLDRESPLDVIQNDEIKKRYESAIAVLSEIVGC